MKEVGTIFSKYFYPLCPAPKSQSINCLKLKLAAAVSTKLSGWSNYVPPKLAKEPQSQQICPRVHFRSVEYRAALQGPGPY